MARNDSATKVHGRDPSLAPLKAATVPDDPLFVAAQSEISRRYGEQERPATILIVTNSGLKVRVDVPAYWRASPPQPRQAGNAHTVDFRSVNWDGQFHTFTETQAACVRILWEAWEQGVPEMGQHAVLEAADSDQKRLDAVFAQHPAWGTMIVPGSTRGTFRLS